MNPFDQGPLTLYLVVVLGLAAVSSVAALGVVADAVVRATRSRGVPRPRPEQRP